MLEFGAKRNNAVQQALVALEESEEKQRLINSEINALISKTAPIDQRIEWYDEQLGRLASLLERNPEYGMRTDQDGNELSRGQVGREIVTGSNGGTVEPYPSGVLASPNGADPKKIEGPARPYAGTAGEIRGVAGYFERPFGDGRPP